MSKHLVSKSILALTLALFALNGQSVQTVENTTVAPVKEESTLVTELDRHSTTTTVAIPTTSEETGLSAVEESSLPTNGQSVAVRILSTTDLHTNLVNYDYYQDKETQNLGLAKTAVLIAKAKAENPNVVLVDNGDIIQGTPLGTYKAIVNPIKDGEQHPMYKALDSLGFDAGTFGNHEFNYGLDFLSKVIATAGMPLVNANVLDAKTNQPLFKTHEIIEKTFVDADGKEVSLKIGITGIVPPQILNWDKALLEGKVLVNDAVESLNTLVPQMRAEGADVVLVLSHSGIGDNVYEKGEENVGYQIAGIPGVDAVVTGHSHAEFPSGDGSGFYEKYPGVDGVNGTINGTPVTMAGKYGDHLGVIDLNLSFTDGKWTVNKGTGSIRKIDTKSTESDSTIWAIAKEAHEGTVNYVRQEVGQTTAPINSFFALVKDDPSVQIVNNAQIWYAKSQLAGTPEANLPILSAAAPFKAGTRGDATAYTDIPAGPIAIKNVADLYLYDNVTAILKVTGADIREWLEMSAGQFNQVDPKSTEPQQLINTDYRTYNFDVIDGLTYQYDITQPNKYDRSGALVNPDASRVRNLQYQGKPIVDSQEFIVVTNNYRASGSFPGVKNATVNRLLNLENRQAIINYILAEKTINPSADSNWTFADTIRGLDLRFLTADRAKNLLTADTKDISYLGASSNEGFGDFRFTYVEPDAVIPIPIEQTTTTSASPQTTTETPSTTSKTPKKKLPKTGSENGYLWTFVGFSILGIIVLRKKSASHD
ncbi:bifunctional 2',3'-cyclic-nucleotide 2'-phosphodiesterase/3'-nucleotidase [Streptococcus sp.]|uniref:bifunctional 2',3'-cyclic-nucleotide 2'-phosphodiesterase/3'-nucleotidase n=1 Tax=Streptococcus sp. TaxID=1306 RepID=UPI0035A19B20